MALTLTRSTYCDLMTNFYLAPSGDSLEKRQKDRKKATPSDIVSSVLIDTGAVQYYETANTASDLLPRSEALSAESRDVVLSTLTKAKTYRERHLDLVKEQEKELQHLEAEAMSELREIFGHIDHADVKNMLASNTIDLEYINNRLRDEFRDVNTQAIINAEAPNKMSDVLKLFAYLCCGLKSDPEQPAPTDADIQKDLKANKKLQKLFASADKRSAEITSRFQHKTDELTKSIIAPLDQELAQLTAEITAAEAKIAAEKRAVKTIPQGEQKSTQAEPQRPKQSGGSQR